MLGVKLCIVVSKSCVGRTGRFVCEVICASHQRQNSGGENELVANAHDYQRKIMTSQNPSDGKLVHLHLQLVTHLIHRPLQISKLGSQLLNCQYKTPGLFPQNLKKNPFSGSSLHFL